MGQMNDQETFIDHTLFIHFGFASVILVFSVPDTFGHLTDVLETA